MIILFFCGGDDMAGDLIYFVITTAITIAIGIISYFLKRTMDNIDKLEENQ